MGAYLLGVALFALGIAVTIALHEAGHMFTARAFGMRVRRYFIGFGPTIWSKRKGHTQYGVAAVPVGGFCDIAGMTAQDPVTAEEAPHAMVNKPWWQRVIVLSGGVIMNLIVGFIILYGVAVTSGIPNPYADHTPTVGEVTCVADQLDTETMADCSGTGPAGEAGVRVGDRILALNGEELEDFYELRDTVLTMPGEDAVLTVERDGQVREITVEVASVTRLNPQGFEVRAGAIGVANAPVENAVRQFGPVEAVGATGAFTWQLLEGTVEAIIQFPAKIPGVVASIFGAERDIEGPMSVVGASRVGGELVERSLWDVFWMMLASLNFFLALFNLIPLPPLDGGHIAVVLYEKIRDLFRRMRGKPAGGPANYEKLMPVTYVMAAALLSVGAIVIVADIVNPVRLFG
ncbi:M50 family metallopeptidase [Corynebacterium halotolerans]|uniref:Zinc metalloprotease Rip1 n=1 Tax=Corynebacterium halotolerans YIM 70093 = DSM 44683 TaxID=1121362 RepID=M1NTF7_9CORY|nr:M50 family metallopeptidase [Corynebacterium halotolerans]AGF72762.1 membrane-associated zinc metalloprotease [Corynebacterium halotolerans YIM 70093 = DSM 44683]